jgi:NAD(P) transhydrogenase subunit alpha
MGGEFLDLDFKEEGAGVGGYAKVMSPEFIKAEMALFAKQAAEVDIIITTALIPGKPAPKLVTAETARLMNTGSVIVDLAAEQGGNCELTEPGRVVRKDGVTVIGYLDMPSRLPTQASQLYATNLRHLLSDMCPKKDGTVVVDFNDEVVRGATIVKDGQITWPPPAPKLSAAPPKPAGGQTGVKPGSDGGQTGVKPGSDRGQTPTWIGAAVAALALYFVGAYAPTEFLQHFTVFVLACFVGYMVVWNVTPALHTPLMSVTNAISSIIAIAALVQVSPLEAAPGGADRPTALIVGLGVVSIALVAINMFGGFAVTQRMLQMFRK